MSRNDLNSFHQEIWTMRELCSHFPNPTWRRLPPTLRHYLLICASPSTEEDFRTYIRQLYFQGSSETELEGLWTNYTSVPSEGSPFGTGDLNQLYPQYKRVASFIGDLIFQSPRRFFLEEVSGKQKTWSYCKLYYFGMWSRNTPNTRKQWARFRSRPRH